MINDKFDKSIMCNEHLEAPSVEVLDAAKADMQRNKPARKKLSPSGIWAIASSCVAVLVVLSCIPLMLPKDYYSEYAKFPSTAGMSQIEISSIEEFNRLYDDNVLTLDGVVPSSSYVYKKGDDNVYCKESYTCGNTEIEIWVELYDNRYGGFYGVDSEAASHFKYERINDCLVEYIKSNDNRVFAKFKYNGYKYMIEMKGEISSWRKILEDFIKIS